MKRLLLSSLSLVLVVSCGEDKCTDANRQRAREYADQHWIESKYIDDRDHPTEVSWYGYWQAWFEENAVDSDLDLHAAMSLPANRDNDYYERIGIHDQFVYGWDDVHGDPLNLSPGDSTLAPDRDILVWGHAGIDTAHFESYIGDVQSAHREEYLDMILLE